MQESTRESSQKWVDLPNEIMTEGTQPPVSSFPRPSHETHVQETRPSSPMSTVSTVVDIEHAPVQNDPRKWSSIRKNLSLFLISFAAMIAGLGANIQNPAVEDMEKELHATSSQYSLSISLFILVQGTMPLVWSTVSEVKGRKLVYLVSLGFFTVASVVVALCRNIALLIAFRAIQAAGSSAVIAIGAATLADIFEPAERGTKMGIYYMAPLLGPAIGPILGGLLTTGLGWRSIFWFLCILAGSSCLSFLCFFQDTFRKERSLTYQNVVKRRLRDGMIAVPDTHVSAVSPKATEAKDTNSLHPNNDLEKGAKSGHLGTTTTPVIDITLSLRDVNPFKPIGAVLRRFNNLVILFASGLMYALSFIISYTTARTLSMQYNYNALKIGLVTISYGLGCVAGSLLGGRWSDYKLAQLRAANDGRSYPEMRLKSTTIGLLLLPPFTVAYGWVCEKHVHIAALCVFLFGSGFFSIWTYTSTLAYIVDANTGRSATAVATNSAFRGFFAFLATEIVVPIQDGIGDGWLYTIWALLMGFSGLGVLTVSWKGEAWRKAAEEREAH